jgi:RNA polymerase sigma-70 factor (ECF subfamily)
MMTATPDAAIADAGIAKAAGKNESPIKQGDCVSTSDVLRLQKARARDRNTLGGIYDEYHPLLYRYIYRRVGDVETARDLTADVFRRFLQATVNGNGPNDQLRAWLYRVAHNIVVDHYRRQHVRQTDLKEEQLVKADDDPGTTAELRIQCVTVRSALERLTTDQQQVIVLKFLEGLTNDEVAHITQKSVGAVKALQHRALAALRRQLIPLEEEVSI